MVNKPKKVYGRVLTRIGQEDQLTPEYALQLIKHVQQTNPMALISLRIDAASDNTWNDMLQLNGMYSVILNNPEHKAVFDFRNNVYEYDNEQIYLTVSERRALYFFLLNGSYVEGYAEIIRNMRRRIGNNFLKDFLNDPDSWDKTYEFRQRR